jgi:hypothetical protein
MNAVLIPEPKKYLVPVHELVSVRGYKTFAQYSYPPATAFIAAKDNAKRETWRVRVTFTDGRDDIVKSFSGWGSLEKAKNFAYWAVMPPLTPAQIQQLL